MANAGASYAHLSPAGLSRCVVNSTVPRLMNMPGSLTMCNSADNADSVAQDETYFDCIAEGSHFEGAILTRVTFTDCDMYWASFFMAELTDVTFERCDLRGSDFKKAKMRNCRFLGCDVGDDAIGCKTEFGDTDLSTVLVWHYNGDGQSSDLHRTRGILQAYARPHNTTLKLDEPGDAPKSRSRAFL